MTTSNFSEAIGILKLCLIWNNLDVAFIDRADLKIHVGLPTTRAIYSILSSCVKELSRVQLISPPVEDLMDANAVSLFEQLQQDSNDKMSASRLLWKISAKSQVRNLTRTFIGWNL